MVFIAKEISISDEGFGITISICQKEDKYNPNVDLSFEEIVNSMENILFFKKLMLKMNLKRITITLNHMIKIIVVSWTIMELFYLIHNL